MDANLILKGSRAKIKRAYSHIDELRRLTDPLDPEFYTLGVERRATIPYANRAKYTLAYRPTQDIPEALALVIGDTLNNLRSSLDYVATAVVRKTKPNAQIHFPIRRKREDLVAAAELAAIEKALPGSKELLLDKIRPEGGPNEAAWAFASINNDDKHNDLVPTVAMAQILGSILTPRGVIRDSVFAGDAKNELRLVTADFPLTVEHDLKVQVDVRFGQGNPLQDQPVIPALLQVAEVIAETLDGFESLIRASRAR